MAESTIAIVILVLALVGLLGAVLWVILSKRKGDWPTGRLVKKDAVGDFVGEIVYQNESYEEFVTPAHLAFSAWCVAMAYRQMGLENPERLEKSLSFVGMVVTTKDAYQKFCALSPEVGRACFVKRKKGIGKPRLPLVVIHTGTIDILESRGEKFTIANRGEPIIHELCHFAAEHAFGYQDRKHVHEKIWVSIGGEKTLQGIAREYYKNFTFKDLEEE